MTTTEPTKENIETIYENQEDSFSYISTNRMLVDWMKEQGADSDMPHTFYLNKGMGERVDITILDHNRIKFNWYGADTE